MAGVGFVRWVLWGEGLTGGEEGEEGGMKVNGSNDWVSGLEFMRLPSSV